MDDVRSVFEKAHSIVQQTHEEEAFLSVLQQVLLILQETDKRKRCVFMP